MSKKSKKDKKSKKVDNVSVGVVVAFDPDTGDALLVHEVFNEAADGADYSTGFTDDEIERVRAEAADRHPRRRIDVVTAPPGREDTQAVVLGDPGLVSYRVDPMTRQVRREPEPDLELLQARLHAALPSDSEH